MTKGTPCTRPYSHGYGHETGNESKVYTVVEIYSVEDKQVENPSMIKFREETGIDHASLEIIALVE